ncbi:rnhA [Lepeophtheirus salmonis]|uniref:RnhA n=1 Tax=Lepeophtheirus salmonis TaxID=72036 RepID=A0A817FE23_LEPSM|nr:rnhA [Lepeophtheirus salmonis]
MNKVLTVIRSAMGKVKSGGYYSVARGRKVGIYNSWSECRSSVTDLWTDLMEHDIKFLQWSRSSRGGTTKELLTGEKSNIFSSNQTPFIYYESGFSKSGAYYAIARGHEVGVFDPCREEAEKCVKEETFNDPWIGEKSNKFRRNHMKNESRFSVDNTDWTYAKD